jgi:RNA polymerase sigma factor (sigma-70 family)
LQTRTTYSEEELIRLLRERNEAVFSYVYDHYSGALFGTISRIVQEEESAADVLQEAFVKIWHNFSSYDPTKGRLFTWMVNVARNLAIDYTRSKNYKSDLKNQSLSDSVGKINRQRNSTPNTDLIGLKSFLDKLSPQHKQIIDLLYFDGYTQEELSKELKIPLGTIKTRARAALKQLRELVK